MKSIALTTGGKGRIVVDTRQFAAGILLPSGRRTMSRCKKAGSDKVNDPVSINFSNALIICEQVFCGGYKL